MPVITAACSLACFAKILDVSEGTALMSYQFII